MLGEGSGDGEDEVGAVKGCCCVGWEFGCVWVRTTINCLKSERREERRTCDGIGSVCEDERRSIEEEERSQKSGQHFRCVKECECEYISIRREEETLGQVHTSTPHLYTFVPLRKPPHTSWVFAATVNPPSQYRHPHSENGTIADNPGDVRGILFPTSIRSTFSFLHQNSQGF